MCPDSQPIPNVSDLDVLAENQAHRQNDQRWRTAFENSAIGIVMADFSGRFIAANSAFLNTLGYTESELYQLTFIDVTYEEDRKLNVDLVRELVEGKRKHFQIEKRYRRKDGTLVWVRTSVALVPGTGAAEPCWFGIVEDSTQRKRVEEELRLQIEVVRASERSLRELTETIPQMLWSADADGGVDYCNQRVLDYTGLSTEQVRGAGWMKAVHHDDIEKMTQAWKAAVSTGEPFQYEFRCLRAIDHAYQWCISSALPLRDQSGRIIKWFGSVVDLHEWKEAQQALQMTQAELARVSRVTTMGELAASIAHEVNQPLAAVTNNASACLRLLADRNLEPAVLRQALEEIVAAGTRASAVIARIRAFIRKAPGERNELDVNEVIQEVLTLTGRELHENRILLEGQLTKPLPRVLGDRVQLQQVVLNLIMNGIEAMTGVTDRPRLLWVQSRMGESGNVLVEVSDSGTGLGLGADCVFSPFFTTKANGMGMGLPISRSLVESHSGRLWATPNSPHGSVFSFTLPVAAGSHS
jgi:PAS domain S-box-containing protein